MRLNLDTAGLDQIKIASDTSESFDEEWDSRVRDSRELRGAPGTTWWDVIKKDLAEAKIIEDVVDSGAWRRPTGQRTSRQNGINVTEKKRGIASIS
ncbi:hypothetical protein V3C99_017661 [Haemonchus contortus]